MQLFRNISIRHRLWLLTAIVVLTFLISMIVALLQLKSSIMDEKIEQVSYLTEVVHNIAAEFDAKAQAGEMSQEQAQAAAVDVVKHLRYDQDNYFWIDDKNGFLLVHPREDLIGSDSKADKDANGKRFGQEINTRAKTEDHGLVEYAWQPSGANKPVDKIAYFRSYRPWGWVIQTGIYLDRAQAAFWRNAIVLGGIGTVLLILIALIATLIARSIVTPIRQAARAMHNIGSGDGDLTQRLAATGSDELTDMAHGFNQFAGKTEDTIRSVGDATTQIASAAEELSAITQTNRGGMDRQRGETQQVASAVTEMSATIGEIAKSAEGAAAAAHTADNDARKGSDTVSVVLETNRKLASEVEKIGQSIRQFNEQSISIGSVVEVIREIAEQTNLLALNAAIEAARAGEQGRGFAVVADEVRTLASRTQSSTGEIQSMVETLQTGAQQAVSAIQQGETITAKTLDQANQAQQLLGEIVQSISTIRDMNTQIASAAEEQSAAAQQIDRSVVNISDLAEEAVQSSEHTAAASTELSRLGSDLSALVGTFRISGQD